MLLIINKNGVNFATSSPTPGDGAAGVDLVNNQSISESTKPTPPKNSSNRAAKGAGSSAAGVNIQNTNPPLSGTTTP